MPKDNTSHCAYMCSPCILGLACLQNRHGLMSLTAWAKILKSATCSRNRQACMYNIILKYLNKAIAFHKNKYENIFSPILPPASSVTLLVGFKLCPTVRSIFFLFFIALRGLLDFTGFDLGSFLCCLFFV